jgi:hypothetical protein
MRERERERERERVNSGRTLEQKYNESDTVTDNAPRHLK